MTIRSEIARLVDEAAKAAQAAGEIPPVGLPEPAVERPARPEHGDYASSLPMRLARTARQAPLALAEAIARHLPITEPVGEVQVAPPGFINIRLQDRWLASQVNAIIAAGEKYGSSSLGKGQRVQIEFVSANPTGPLHVGNGRWASIGDSLARVLEAAGYEVEREYLVNDAGTQAALFADSVFARYLQLFGKDAQPPADGYHGDYVGEIAEQIRDEVGDRFLSSQETPAELKRLAIAKMVDRIRDDMAAIGVHYDVWFFESSLYEESNTFETAMKLIKQQGAVVEKEGAVWFASSALGEDKDNVIIRSNGAPTYFASDIAYHYDKFMIRGFDKVIDIWGADHQGHVSRVKTAVQALGVPEGRLEIIIGQLVSVRRGDSAGRLSKRAGNVISLREVVDEVGKDACRFFFLSRSADSQMEFDLDLAKKQSSENPVYYVQYAHARIAGILTQAAERDLSPEGGDVSLLTDPAEMALIRKMLLLPELIESIAESHEPHHLPHYAMDLATAFHEFYERCRVMPRYLDDEGRERTPSEAEVALARARLRLVAAAKITLARTLGLMGMEAPERM
ncbi:MAG TPA: arginine--tRNA ligase [Dehalococcoidia bacterium]|nr:arginine--tRNA ligase [Dehalococcoidia bacterium]